MCYLYTFFSCFNNLTLVLLAQQQYVKVTWTCKILNTKILTDIFLTRKHNSVWLSYSQIWILMTNDWTIFTFLSHSVIIFRGICEKLRGNIWHVRESLEMFNRKRFWNISFRWGTSFSPSVESRWSQAGDLSFGHSCYFACLRFACGIEKSFTREIITRMHLVVRIKCTHRTVLCTMYKKSVDDPPNVYSSLRCCCHLSRESLRRIP